jgi:hypothetical protein
MLTILPHLFSPPLYLSLFLSLPSFSPSLCVSVSPPFFYDVSEEANDLEGDDQKDRENNHQQDGEAHALAVDGVCHHDLQLLLRGPQPTVRHLHILIQLIQQPTMQIQLLIYSQGNVLFSPATQIRPGDCERCLCAFVLWSVGHHGSH